MALPGISNANDFDSAHDLKSVLSGDHGRRAHRGAIPASQRRSKGRLRPITFE